jgi:Tol biopolymer transport system component
MKKQRFISIRNSKDSMMKVSCLITCLFILIAIGTHAQVSNVEFGKNRVQYQKFKWRYYQTENFNTYFSQDGLGLGKYVAQIAETELPGIEEFVEYGLQRRINIVAYNNFDEFQQSNIGLGIDWQNTGGITKLVNNKMLVYFDGNHDNLRRQIRQGLARVLVENVLFGDDLGEFAANQALLDLPKWLTDGYIEYAAENWSPKLDDDLRSIMLAGKYTNFYQFAFDKPELAGHSFWKYIADKYGKTKVTYFLYLSRIYRNLNNASQKVTKKKFKAVLKDFMLEIPQQYYKDIRGRRNAPKGQLGVSEVIGKKDFIRFNAHPNPRSFTYAVVEFKQGKYSVVLVENFVTRKVLLKYGTRSKGDELNPNYPILAWDGKGTRLAVLYSQEGKLKLFVYDIINRVKIIKQELPMFNQVQDMKYMLDANTLIFSAIRSGQTDIFVYKIDSQSYDQITNDVYDDLDPSFVAFPNKTGIIYSSNRPSATAATSEDSLPGKRFNIFLVDNWNKSEFKQISQLTALNRGNARYPSQYNTSHFTFISDENGINNRYAGFFRTERAGLDTLVFIGDEVLRNPPRKEVDSLLKEWNKTDIDSVGFVSITNDSSYTFPLTNYQSSMLETRTAGDNQQVSEVVKLGDVKLLYRLRVDENVLRRRNINARPTEYMKQVIDDDKRIRGKLSPQQEGKKPDTNKQNDFFQSEFGDEKKDSTQLGKVVEVTEITEPTILRKAKLYEYRPPKFFADYAVTGFNNSVLAVNKFQPFTGGGPVYLSNGGDFNGLIRLGTSDLMEDVKFTGGIRIAPNLRDNDVMFSFLNLRKRLDWGVIYYRSSQEGFATLLYNGSPVQGPGKQFSSYYLATLKYPLDRIRSIRATIGPRFDRTVLSSTDQITIKVPDTTNTNGQFSLEYVYDNTTNPATNIWHGLRYKIFGDWFTQISRANEEGRFMFNVGFDARHYLPIYRNLIWAVRAGGDFSFGDQKIVYYLGGVDNWFSPKFNDADRVNPSVEGPYTYQSLAVNLRGFPQNAAHGNNAMVLNSEIRVPVFTTFFNKPINNAFLRNFQVVQFFDIGTAWFGSLKNIRRPQSIYTGDQGNPFSVRMKSGGIGPFAGGYGFGARSTLLGYFIRVDAAWEMNGVFKGKPSWYFAMGFDF